MYRSKSVYMIVWIHKPGFVHIIHHFTCKQFIWFIVEDPQTIVVSCKFYTKYEPPKSSNYILSKS